MFQILCRYYRVGTPPPQYNCVAYSGGIEPAPFQPTLIFDDAFCCFLLIFHPERLPERQNLGIY